MSPSSPPSEEQRVTRLSIILVILVFSVKVTVSFFTQSLSFLVELSDSIIDLIAVSITFFALKESQKKPDFEHMYGHYKINSFAAFLQGLLILVLYGGLLYNAIRNWVLGTLIQPENTLLGGIALFFVIFIVFTFSQKIIQIGKVTKNQLIIAQGVNFRGDFYRNITVIVTLVVTSIGIPYIDSIVAITFSLKSIYEGLKILYNSYNELIDTNLISESQYKQLEAKLTLLPGVKQIEDLKIRTVGNNLDLSMGVEVDTDQSSEMSDRMTMRMRHIIETEFSDYECNTVIYTLSSQNPNNLANSEIILEIIRKSASGIQNISNVHNISIDQFQDEYLIQMHVDIPGTMNLKEGHSLISKYENEISEKVLEIIGNETQIEIISHLEPIHEAKRIHSHHVLKSVSVDMEKEAYAIIKRNEGVQDVLNLRILDEPEGIYLSCTLKLYEDLSITQTHAITESVEFDLFSKFPRMEHCTIHAEPI